MTYRTALTKKYKTPIAVIPIKTYRALFIIAPSRLKPIFVCVPLVVVYLWESPVLMLMLEVFLSAGGPVVLDFLSVSSAKETTHKVKTSGRTLKCVIVAWVRDF